MWMKFIGAQYGPVNTRDMDLKLHKYALRVNMFAS